MKLKYYSTKDSSYKVNFETALLKSLAPDKGLYMPQYIPKLDNNFICNLHNKSFQEICLYISSLFLSDDINYKKLIEIIETTINFDAPIVKLDNNINILELWHGPTMAFKDFGARFMAQLMKFFIENSSNTINILVATSGDTGSAIANSFLGIKGIKVYVLYPKNRVSKIQEKQFTTLGRNIIAFEVDGSFDDCQKLVKTAFLDKELNKVKNTTSANSINIGRLIPQIFYYVYTFSQIKTKKNVVFSVPSGNFGNLTAGLISKQMGLPIKKFIASTNINNIVPLYLKTGLLKPLKSIQTISNAMDVGNPSNFERINSLFKNSFSCIKKSISGFYFNDYETKKTIEEIYLKYKYIVDPHSAVGYLGLSKYIKENSNTTGVFLGTAHPAKFLEVVKPIINNEIKIPKRLQTFLDKDKKSIQITTDYKDFKNNLLNIN